MLIVHSLIAAHANKIRILYKDGILFLYAINCAKPSKDQSMSLIYMV